MSLEGKTVVITRAKDRAGSLNEALVELGATVIEVPAIEILDPESWDALDRAIAEIDHYALILISSVNAAERFAARAGALGIDLSKLSYGAVGEATARWIEEEIGGSILAPDSEFRGEALARVIAERWGPDLRGRRFLIPSAREAREALADSLRALGAEVHVAETYRIACAPPIDPARVPQIERADAFLFLSGRTLECFLGIVPKAKDLLARAVVGVIGPVASDAAARLGVRVDVVPVKASSEDLARALAAHLSRA